MFDTLKSIYSSLYTWWRPLPTDDEIAEIVRSIIGRPQSNDAKIDAAQPVCVISFSNGDRDICLPAIHDVPHCDAAAARINQRSGRSDARGNLLNGCTPSSKTVMPAP